MPVSKRLRYEILRRDNHTCRYCGSSAPDVRLTVDHVTPVALGGNDEPTNLVAACAACNSGKTSSSPDAPLVDDVAQDALRWSKAMQAAAEIHREDQQRARIMADNLGEWWKDTWTPEDQYPLVIEGSWTYEDRPGVQFPWGVEIDDTVVAAFRTEEEAYEDSQRRRERMIPPRPEDWQSAARAWVTAGITDHDYVPLMEMVRDERRHVAWDVKWKYFAGCVWNVIRQRQEIASALLEAGKEDADAE